MIKKSNNANIHNVTMTTLAVKSTEMMDLETVSKVQFCTWLTDIDYDLFLPNPHPPLAHSPSLCFCLSLSLCLSAHSLAPTLISVRFVTQGTTRCLPRPKPASCFLHNCLVNFTSGSLCVTCAFAPLGHWYSRALIVCSEAHPDPRVAGSNGRMLHEIIIQGLRFNLLNK